MITVTEKVYKRVRELWNDEYELNPGHRIIQSVQMTDHNQVEVELTDFCFYLAEEDGQLVIRLGSMANIESPAEEEMTKVVVHLADLVKNLTGDLPLKVVQP